MIYYRVYKENKASNLEIPYFMFPFMRRYWTNALYMQGYGRHTEEESIQLYS